ncbi:GntR family transcriptional regulator [Geobacillus sp. C56-T2]|uniref:GntR family transcriptional regulator n=1 Tax=Geobacillus sp. C56-T2 TaxID=600773 RepID=UPI0011A5E923|nr:GntR family transcriptional regulator [Geobacillus sp. C56-T2]NNV06316.1 GntR family transcriptional regulator [Geobacillus sp. MMMUD3]TWG32138.1 DNA-binding GntR family transcriptional regulator [Geobacillus sp. C56-T2]
MNQTQPDRSAPFYEQIYHLLRQKILHGEFKAGERIYEARLARELNVSRSPVREAVRALEKEGLLRIDQKSRIMVYKPTIRDMEEIYHCRMSLESLAAKLACERASDHQLNEIEEVLRKTEQSIISGDLESVIKFNAQFHDLIVLFSGNSVLNKMLEGLRSLAYYYRKLNVYGPTRAKQILEEHREILFRMKERKVEEAAETMRIHIQHDLFHLNKILTQNEQGGEKFD